MKVLEYLQNNKWVVHYRRPDNHPDVEEFRRVVSVNPFYRIRTEAEQK
jgi:hypothetical protein